MHSNTLIIASLIASTVSLIVAVFAVTQARNLRAWRKNFGPEEHPENLEQIITSIVGKIKALETRQTGTDENFQQLKETLSYATQKVGVVRYDSQADEGGNLSFSLALLDDHHTGIVITSLYGRQNNRIYSKRIDRGSSEATLTDQERDAVFQAIGELPKTKTAKTGKH